MRRNLYVSFMIPASTSKDAFDGLLLEMNCRSALVYGRLVGRTNSYELRYSDHDPSLDLVRRILQRKEISWSERLEVRYSDSELLALSYLIMGLGTVPVGYGGPRYGTEYDLENACRKCGTGAIQTSPLFVRPSDLPKRGVICQTHSCEILLRGDLAALLTQEQSGEMELRRVHASTDHRPLDWFQLIALCTMPPFSESTTGVVISDQCPECNRDGYFDTPTTPRQLVYCRNDMNLSAEPIVANTHECFGISRLQEPFSKSFLASPLLLVKPQMLSFMRRHRVARVGFEPVFVLG